MAASGLKGANSLAHQAAPGGLGMLDGKFSTVSAQEMQKHDLGEGVVVALFSRASSNFEGIRKWSSRNRLGALA
jgi:hypothetical protein